MSETEEKFYCIYYKTNSGKFRVVHSETKQIIEIPHEKMSELRLTEHIHKTLFFEMNRYAGKEGTDEGLIEYLDLFKQWVHELKNNDIYKIDVLTHYNWNSLVYHVFEDISKFKPKSHDRIDTTERKWIDGCYNSGIKFVDPQKCTSYAFDYSNNYAKIMSTESFKVPTRRGKEGILTQIPDDMYKLPYGYYRCKITSKDSNFRKMFSTSDNDIYFCESLKFALMHAEKFDIKIRMILDGEPNVYLYDEKHLTNGKKLFKKWFDVMDTLKKKFPKNVLVKLLCSSLHGVLVTHSKKNVPEQTIDDFDYSWSDKTEWLILDKKEKSKSNKYYTLINRKNPFKYNLRVKCIHAYARNKIARLAMMDIDNVVRINVDSVAFTRNAVDPLRTNKIQVSRLDLNTLKLEEKYSGKGEWVNLTTFVKD